MKFVLLTFFSFFSLLSWEVDATPAKCDKQVEKLSGKINVPAATMRISKVFVSDPEVLTARKSRNELLEKIRQAEAKEPSYKKVVEPIEKVFAKIGPLARQKGVSPQQLEQLKTAAIEHLKPNASRPEEIASIEKNLGELLTGILSEGTFKSLDALPLSVADKVDLAIDWLMEDTGDWLRNGIREFNGLSVEDGSGIFVRARRRALAIGASAQELVDHPPRTYHTSLIYILEDQISPAKYLDIEKKLKTAELNEREMGYFESGGR